MSSIPRRHVLTIIPSFNRAHFLSEAIASVIAQDYPHKKIIIIDDGSVDGTESLCRKLMSQHPAEISYIYQDNKGCSAARNRGLDIVDEDTGFVCFLDSDDRFLPGKFTREVRLLQENPQAGFTYSDAIIFDTVKNTERLYRAASAGAPEKFAIELFLTNEAKSSAILYRAGILEDLRFREDFLFNEDTDFLQNIALAHSAIYADEAGTWVRWHEGSKSRNTLEILKAVLKSKQELILRNPTFYRENKSKIDQFIKKNHRDLAIEMILAEQWNEVPQHTDDPLLRLQSTLHFPYLYRARRTFSIWFNRRFR